jgi:hypothetical protein
MDDKAEDYDDLMYLWDSLNYAPKESSPVQVKVFIGGFDSIQIALLQCVGLPLKRSEEHLMREVA